MVHGAGLNTLLLTIPKRSDISSKDERRRVKTNTKLRDWALKNNNTTWLVDLAKRFPSSGRYWDDSVHPNARGYDVMADFVFRGVVRMYDNMSLDKGEKEEEDGSGSGCEDE